MSRYTPNIFGGSKTHHFENSSQKSFGKFSHSNKIFVINTFSVSYPCCYNHFFAVFRALFVLNALLIFQKFVHVLNIFILNY